MSFQATPPTSTSERTPAGETVLFPSPQRAVHCGRSHWTDEWLGTAAVSPATESKHEGCPDPVATRGTRDSECSHVTESFVSL